MFENVLANWTVTAVPNLVWQIDGTFMRKLDLECALKKEPNLQHFVLIGIDTSTNKVKPFSSKKGKDKGHLYLKSSYKSVRQNY